MKKYRFYEPHPTGGDSVVTISEKKAIKYTKKIIKEAYGEDVSDELALEEFITNYWAEEVEDE